MTIKKGVTVKKVMTASAVDKVSQIEFPVALQGKFDGVRATVQNGIVYARSLKPIPNKFVQDLFGRPEHEGFDGELIVGDPCEEGVYGRTTSGVMSHEGEPDVRFYVFDIMMDNKPFNERFRLLSKMYLERLVGERICPVGTAFVDDEDDLIRLEESFVEAGYEGIMLRSPGGLYKHGKSTIKQGYLLKWKRFEDIEAMIIGYEPLYHNMNEATKNELGRTHRSAHKENKVADELLGSLTCRSDLFEFTFKVGTGFYAKQREELWKQRDSLIGKLAKIKYQPSGVKDRPRFPTFLGLRDIIDLDPE